MKRLFTSSMMLVALAVLLTSAREAQAGGFKFNGGGGGGIKMAKSGSGGGGQKQKSFALQWGNSGNNVMQRKIQGNCHVTKVHHNGHWHTKKFCATPIVVEPVVRLQKVPAGSTITIPCRNLGFAEGYVYLHVGGLKLPVEILKWTPGAVTLQLPPMKMTYATKAHLDIYRPCGTLAKQLPILLVAQTAVIVH